MDQLKRTPLYDVYKAQSKMIPFGGWEMPVQFSGIKEEHEAVRTRAGLFDVSHMGEVEVKGPDALALVQKLTTNDASKLQIGDAQYSLMCLPDGGTVDDLLIYRTGEDTYLLVINASNIDKDVDWIQKHADGNVTVRNVSAEIGQLAIQGPLAEKVLQKLTDTDLSEIRFFKFKQDVDMAGVKALVSRSGYTGEDGFELYVKAEDTPKLWHAILEAGKEEGVLPCGLGARDTLRFEARLPLYGQELSETITPIEAGLGFAVKPEKGEFIGREVLARQKSEGAPRKLVGLEMIDRGIPRHGYTVYKNGEKIGEVTTGTQSPTLKKNVGLALISAEHAHLDEVVEVEIRGKKLKAKIVKTPFYKRPAR
ncbi:glycine cleavage system aminomethyltransferase GcvT [Staphylospora marina]|uniref:glycine cleavage system aminomethyltransferase GcvT n=1 Tax=Staphylospora marina TaxID=2490858 RepID=UPI000F5BA06E|nr:glycine cleavage system aminomethyltransferase GcvT [Staphylospora marina]